MTEPLVHLMGGLVAAAESRVQVKKKEEKPQQRLLLRPSGGPVGWPN